MAPSSVPSESHITFVIQSCYDNIPIPFIALRNTSASLSGLKLAAGLIVGCPAS